jgi:hypothetical protein
MSYAVTAPLVIARDTTGRQHHLYTGARLPEDIDPDQLEQLIDSGMVAEVEDDEKPAKKGKSKSEKDDAPAPDKPAPVKDILAEVGDDKEKAAAALEAENALDKPRPSLVTKLQAVVDAEAS